MELAKVAQAPEKFRINKFLLIKSAIPEAVFGRDFIESRDSFPKTILSS